MRPLPVKPGDVYGLLTVVGVGTPYVDARGWKQGRWLCRCACGEERHVAASALLRNNPSCGCTRQAGLKAAGALRRRERISYFGMHRRLKLDKGSASDYLCIDCGETAQHWTYTGGDPYELHYDPPGKRRLSYSLDPDRYSPRCRGCHNRHDGVKPPPRIKRQKA